MENGCIRHMLGNMAQSKPPRAPGRVRSGPRKIWWLPSKWSKTVSAYGFGLHAAARQCNVPAETLRRRVVGAVGVDCKPGPPTVLTPEEVVKLVNYIIDISDMGFGLTRQDVMRIAYEIWKATSFSECLSRAFMVWIVSVSTPQFDSSLCSATFIWPCSSWKQRSNCWLLC